MQHPDEGTIHAWLDGELPEERANEIAAHAGDCPECSARVAEARGLIAASTRILTALDNIPAGVIPEEAGMLPAPAPPSVRRRPWYDRMDIRVAAAVLVVAGASYLLIQRDSGASRETLMVADKIQPASTPVAAADSAAVALLVAPPVSAQRAVAKTAPPTTTINKAMSKASNAEGEARTPAALRQDAAIAAPPVAEPMSVTLRPPAASAAGGITITTKRGNKGDSAYSIRERSVAGAARAEPPFGVVEGRVVDQKDDKGLVGASVMLPGTSLYTSTDKDGRFSITNVPAGNHNLTVRRIGYVQQYFAIAVPDDATVTANVAMVPSTMAFSNVVATGVATSGNVVYLPLRVINADSVNMTHRTVYEISPGVRVTLADSPVDAGKEEAAFIGQLKRGSAAAPQRTADASEKKVLDSVGTTRAPVAQSTMAAAAPPPPVNMISWTDRGRRYELSGPVSTETLQLLKKQLMQLRK